MPSIRQFSCHEAAMRGQSGVNFRIFWSVRSAQHLPDFIHEFHEREGFSDNRKIFSPNFGIKIPRHYENSHTRAFKEKFFTNVKATHLRHYEVGHEKVDFAFVLSGQTQSRCSIGG